MYLQMAGLVFMPTGVILYVINYADLDRQHLARELDERYEPFHHWGDVPDDFSYGAPYRHQLRDGVVSPAPAEPPDVLGDPSALDYRFHYRRLLLMDRLHAALRAQRITLMPCILPLQDRVLDLALAECGQPGAQPLLTAMSTAWGTSLDIAAERVRIEHADRQDALVQSELRRLDACAQIRAARDHADLDVLSTKYGGHD